MKAIHAALEQLGIFRGTILSPEDFAGLRRGVGNSTPELTGWGFAVPVSDPIGMALRREGPGGLFVGLLQTPSGLELLCATLQVGRAQVRIVVDSADSRAQGLLHWSAKHGEMRFICSTSGENQARLIAFPVDKTYLESVIEHSQTSRALPPLLHAVELAMAVHELTALDFIESCEEGVDVNEVVVCPITPDATEIGAMRRAAGAATVH